MTKKLKKKDSYMSEFPGKQALSDFKELSKLKLPGLLVLFFIRVTS